MTNKITQKITSYRVKNNDTEQPQEQTIIEPSVMHEGIKRNDILDSRTYKIKLPTSEHAVYATIGHIEVNGVIHAYEIFLNSKDTSHHQWVSALTRLISAVLRKGGDVRFIANELLQIFDPNGGHWTKKGSNGEKPRFMASLIAEIGLCLEKHFDYIDYLNNSEIEQKEPVLIDVKEAIEEDQDEVKYPDNATVCPESSCRAKSVVLMDGCPTCLACGASKCS